MDHFSKEEAKTPQVSKILGYLVDAPFSKMYVLGSLSQVHQKQYTDVKQTAYAGGFGQSFQFPSNGVFGYEIQSYSPRHKKSVDITNHPTAANHRTETEKGWFHFNLFTGKIINDIAMIYLKGGYASNKTNYFFKNSTDKREWQYNLTGFTGGLGLEIQPIQGYSIALEYLKDEVSPNTLLLGNNLATNTNGDAGLVTAGSATENQSKKFDNLSINLKKKF